jgi:hypothetical protein
LKGGLCSPVTHFAAAAAEPAPASCKRTTPTAAADASERRRKLVVIFVFPLFPRGEPVWSGLAIPTTKRLRAGGDQLCRRTDFDTDWYTTGMEDVTEPFVAVSINPDVLAASEH